ncbi:IS1096 element passenger TnpR family protein [Actinoplanes sp. NPDC026623]|uniref:IS1096 element passenger TnpR family protein n=1 Tax=Actinoplanes sp. NPDC026623 TaxID=3155610 RepID=UPI0033DC18EF
MSPNAGHDCTRRTGEGSAARCGPARRHALRGGLATVRSPGPRYARPAETQPQAASGPPACRSVLRSEGDHRRVPGQAGEVGAEDRGCAEYFYDLGDHWEHRMMVERIIVTDEPEISPVCVGGQGDAPEEDWFPGCGRHGMPFDLASINEKVVRSPPR